MINFLTESRIKDFVRGFVPSTTFKVFAAYPDRDSTRLFVYVQAEDSKKETTVFIPDGESAANVVADVKGVIKDAGRRVT